METVIDWLTLKLSVDVAEFDEMQLTTTRPGLPLDAVAPPYAMFTPP